MNPIFELLKIEDEPAWQFVLRQESFEQDAEVFLKDYQAEPDLLQGNMLRATPFEEALPILDSEGHLAGMTQPVVYSNVSEWNATPRGVKYYLVDEGA